MHIALRIAALAVVANGAVAAHAAVIDFNELRKPSGETYVYGAYTNPTGDYKLTADRCSSPAGTCFITTANKGVSGIDFSVYSAANPTTGLTNFVGSSVTTLARADGAAFLLNSIMFAPSASNYLGYSADTVGLQFTFTFADGRSPLTENILIANTVGLRVTKTTLDFSSYGALTAFSWKPTTNAGGFVQFDNINVSTPTAAVPEPATWAMLIAGFGLVGGAARSRRIRALA